METNFNNEIFPTEKFKTESEYIASLIQTIDSIETDIQKRANTLIKLETFYEKREADEKRMARLDLFKKEFGELNVTDKKGKTKKYEGLYIFIDKDKPVYVGISRNIISRLRNHAWGKTSVTSSLAYLMAKQEHGNLNKDIYKDNINEIREKYLEKVREFKLYIYPFKGQENTETSEYYSLQLLEVLLSVRLKTCWNTFKTH